MSIDDLKVRDEVLQVMFWMLGENIAHEIDARYLARFLSLPEGARTGSTRAVAVFRTSSAISRSRRTASARRDAGATRRRARARSAPA